MPPTQIKVKRVVIQGHNNVCEKEEKGWKEEGENEEKREGVYLVALGQDYLSLSV